MLPITLVRHPLKFYLMQAFGFLIIAGIGFGISWGSAQGINSPDVKRSDYLFLAIGLVFVFLAFYMVFKYFKNSPLIEADESTIRFSTHEVYQISDIVDIQLTGKVPFPMLLNFPMEGTAIHFKNGTKKFFYDDLYSNGWELKSFLEQTVVNKKPYEVRVQEVNEDNPDLYDMEVFKGHPVFSFRGIMLWVMMGFMISVMFFGRKPVDTRILVFFVGLSIFFFLLMSQSMNYFGLTSEYLIVKNHHLMWRTHFYKIGDIKEIVFETHSKAPNCLRLITRDFKTKLYPAGTLHDKHWLELMDRLQEKGVAVRNECIAVEN